MKNFDQHCEGILRRLLTMMNPGISLGESSHGTSHHLLSLTLKIQGWVLDFDHSLREARLCRMRMNLAPLTTLTQCQEIFIRKVAYPLTHIGLGTSNLHRTRHRFRRHQEHLQFLYRGGLTELDDSQLQDLEMYTGIAIPRNVTRWILGHSYLMRELLSNPQQEIRSPRNLHHLVVTSTHRQMALVLGHYATKILS